MKHSVVKIGYCPTRRVIFDAQAPYEYNQKIRDTITNLSPYMEFVFADEALAGGLLDDMDKADALIRAFRAAKVDALFVANCNFGSEGLVARVAAALNVPVLVWGPRDEGPDPVTGLRARDSQCGLFALGKVLRHYNVPFTYLLNSAVESEYFQNGLVKFAAVANVVKKFRSLRILQISTRPTPFLSVMINESELLERFGIEIVPVALNELITEINDLRAKPDEDTQQVARMIRTELAGGQEVNVQSIETLAAVKGAIKRLIQKYHCTAAAIQCWSALCDITEIMPCLATSLLADEGIPVFCETDVCGAISAVMSQAAAFDTEAQFFADITTRHPSDDNAELLWHCGPFPYSLKCPDCKGVVSGCYTQPKRELGFCEWKLKDGDITVARFDGDHGDYRLLIGEAKTTEGPHNRGTYVWIKVDDWAKWERKLVEGPYIHHVAGSYGHYGEILAEACKYIPGLTVDFAENGEKIMRRWD